MSLPEAYQTLAATVLTSQALSHPKVQAQVNADLENGATIEEAIMHAYVMDVALQAEQSGEDAAQLVMVTYGIGAMLTRFKEWREAHRIRQELWTTYVALLMKLAT